MRFSSEITGATASGTADPAIGTSVAAEADAATHHVVKYRVSLPFFGGRYYFAFFSGRCQRSIDRIVAEGQRRSWIHTSFSFGTLFLIVSTMLMCGVATAYVAKSLLGIDLFDDHFILHNLFFN